MTTEKIFLTSDTHFNHANIIGYCNRPFIDVFEMNRELIRRWNETVGPEDTIFHLGDFAMGDHDVAPGIFDQLNGVKHLIVGNHDSGKTKKMGWASVTPANMLASQDGVFMMVHNPAVVSPRSAPATVLHGHLHGQPGSHPYKKHPHIRYIDVGVDCWDYRPITLDAVKILAGAK